MTDSPERRRAAEVPSGNLVQVEGDGTWFMKAEREGKEYVHHYLVRLHPRADRVEDTAILYLDPDDPLLDHDRTPDLDLGDAGSGDARPECGDLFRTAKGTFFKALEDPKAQKHVAYVNVASGDFARRQERGVEAVYAGWRLRVD